MPADMPRGALVATFTPEATDPIALYFAGGGADDQEVVQLFRFD
jgi:hypothetical protein